MYTLTWLDFYGTVERGAVRSDYKHTLCIVKRALRLAYSTLKFKLENSEGLDEPVTWIEDWERL